MNAHQRRKTSRRNHMDLPLGKPIDFNVLQGRKVYAYGELSRCITLNSSVMDQIGSASVHRHFTGKVDLLLTARNGKQQVIQTSKRGLRLLHPEDRAAYPWWSQTRIRARSAA